MKKNLFTLVLTLTAVFLFVTGFAADAVPKYVFLLIGDGMGKPHVDLARQLNGGKLTMDELPVRGSVSTVDAKKQTTDSAASGTAYACGIKTLCGRLGMDADGKAVDSCAVFAKRQGRSVAILTTVGANNATPAAFYAHVLKRGESKEIINQYPEAGFDILAGSGIDGMSSKVKQEDYLTGKAYIHDSQVKEGSADFNGKNILVIAKDDKPFFELKDLSMPVFVYSKGTDDLAKYVRKSIELMESNPKGFFMMAEGGRIDHAAHGNNPKGMLAELMKFDKAVGVALEFYKKHPEETLIIVSADHHTGGLKLTGKIDTSYFDLQVGSFKVNAAKDTEEEILSKLQAKKVDCTDTEKAELHAIFEKAAEKPADEKAAKKQAKTRTESVNKFLASVISARSGLTWSTHGHTSDPVYLFAIGVAADKFAGDKENSDIGAGLKALFSDAR